MKILILTSCVKTKKVKGSMIKKLLQDSGYETPSDDLENEQNYRKILLQYVCSAKEMYQGSFKKVSNLVEKLGKRAITHFYIISARYGIIDENQLVIPYESTFRKKSKKEIRSKAKQLGIYKKLIDILEPNHYNQVIVILGLKYLLTIFDEKEKYDFTKHLKNAKLTIFTSEKMRKKIQYSNLEFIPIRGIGDRNKKIMEYTEKLLLKS